MVDGGRMLEQELQGSVFTLVSGPHERSRPVTSPGVGIRAMLDQFFDRREVFTVGILIFHVSSRVMKGRAALPVPRIRGRATSQEEFYHRRPVLGGGSHQGPGPIETTRVEVRAMGQQNPGASHAALARGEDQGGRAIARPDVRRSALRQ